MIDGALLIGGEARQAADRFTAVNPATGDTLTPDFSSAGKDAVAEACALAEAAFPAYAATDPATRAAFLEAIADAIVGIGDALIERAMAESGLPRARLEGERGRTVGSGRDLGHLQQALSDRSRQSVSHSLGRSSGGAGRPAPDASLSPSRGTARDGSLSPSKGPGRDGSLSSSKGHGVVGRSAAPTSSRPFDRLRGRSRIR